MPKQDAIGLIYAAVTHINGEDVALARRKVVGEEEIGQMTLNALVDAGAYDFRINEEIQAQLGFPVVEIRKAKTADGRIVECDWVDFFR